VVSNMKRPEPGTVYALLVHADKPAPLWHRRLASYLTALRNGHEAEGEREVAREDLSAEIREWFKEHTLKQHGRGYTGVSRAIESPGWFRSEGMHWREGQEEEAREARDASLRAEAERHYKLHLAQYPDSAKEKRDRLLAMIGDGLHTFPAEMGMEMAFDEKPPEGLWPLIQGRVRGFLHEEDIQVEELRLVCTEVAERTVYEWIP